ncbi:MAG: cytochrome c [Gemmatimonadota bacterium]|jgi:mono/diheme cytochrome c family protein
MMLTFRSFRVLALPVVATLVLTGCDDQVKRVPWFKTMFRTESVRTYEVEHRLPPEGAVYVGAPRHLDLLAADTLAVNPLTATPEVLEQGEVLFLRYCVMCHGPEGAGDGPVVGENRLPPLPTLNLLSDRAKNDLSDGYIWGMIANGRGVMPSYRRIPHRSRWQIVEYVRSLQEASSGGATAGTAEAQAGND